MENKTLEVLRSYDTDELHDVYKATLNHDEYEWLECVFYTLDEVIEYYDNNAQVMFEDFAPFVDVNDDLFYQSENSWESCAEFWKDRNLENNVEGLAEWLVEYFEGWREELEDFDVPQELKDAIEGDIEGEE